MTEIRVFYKKQGRMKFVSHLDMTRFFTRMLRKAEIPVYYTEGFNKHPYIVFALPLSLGFDSAYEVLDFRITEEMTYEEIKNRLASQMPNGIEIIKVCAPNMKHKQIKYAEYEITFFDNLKDKLETFLSKPEILTEKKGKKGKISTLDLKPEIVKYSITEKENNTLLTVTLPAGSEKNINPTLLISAFLGENDVFYSVLRKKITDENFNIFE